MSLGCPSGLARHCASAVESSRVLNVECGFLRREIEGKTRAKLSEVDINDVYEKAPAEAGEEDDDFLDGAGPVPLAGSAIL